MRLSRTLKAIVKEEGRHSISAKAIQKLKRSKEFDYLVDMKR